MHLAEGILPAQWAAAWAVPAVAGTAVGLRKVKKKADDNPSYKPLLGLIAAAVFAISLMPIPVPVAGSVSHPTGVPLAAVLVGPAAAVLLAALSLLFQALFFAHGGITTLGANVVSMGIVGSLAGFSVFWIARRSGRSVFTAGLLAGMIGDLAVYAATAAELGLGLFPVGEAGRAAGGMFLAFLPTQLPLAVLEGVVTGGILRSIVELRPDVAQGLRLASEDEGSARKVGSRRSRAREWWRGAARPVRVGVGAVALAGALVLGWGMLWAVARSTGSWVGLDEGVMEATAEEAGRAPWDPIVNTDQGDLLLFVFFWGAVIAGFAAAFMLRRVTGGSSGGFAGETRRPWRLRLVQGGVAATVLVAAVVWMFAFPETGIAGVTGESARLFVLTVLRPTTREVVSSRGGDLTLFVFMVAGLVFGGFAGFKLGGRR